MLKHQTDVLKCEKSRSHWLYIYCHVTSYDAVYCHMTSYDSIPILIHVVRIPDAHLHSQKNNLKHLKTKLRAFEVFALTCVLTGPRGCSE